MLCEGGSGFISCVINFELNLNFEKMIFFNWILVNVFPVGWWDFKTDIYGFSLCLNNNPVLKTQWLQRWVYYYLLQASDEEILYNQRSPSEGSMIPGHKVWKYINLAKKIKYFE